MNSAVLLKKMSETKTDNPIKTAIIEDQKDIREGFKKIGVKL